MNDLDCFDDPVIRGLCRAVSLSGRYDWFVSREVRTGVLGEQTWLCVIDKEMPLFDPGADHWFCVTSPSEGQWRGLIGMLGLNDQDVLDGFYERVEEVCL